VGTTLVTVPLILSFLLAAEGPQWKEAISLSVLAVVVSGLDNLIRPLLLKEGLRLHPLWILLSILGGVNFFGALGLVLGPMVVVFFGTFLALVTQEARSASKDRDSGATAARREPARASPA
jgi:predicted PurR-regulated permease PerM